MSARILDKALAERADAWSFPPVGAAPAARGRLPTADELRELERTTREAAEREGRAEGLAAGRAEAEARASRLAALADALARPLENLDHEVERQLIALAMALASHILRRELARDAAPTVEAVRECLAALPSATRDVSLHLHPEDAALVAEHLDAHAPRAWKLVPDEGLARGDVKVESESSRINGQLEARLNEIVAAALGRAEPDEAR